ncbi:ABC transporter ATP-binding protein [Petrotoga sp. 9PWA.NaAc.5.4]|uniref:ABC transporter ATP-binding protein n=1 Tax=Petrotoga sp. 9PWA.NaAc.5.4 TaxID=1434328 RepID=UPI000CB74714|nr:ABC transporter ATP-binding protein [Petrotoga sp. 9PWA.NaAc.5.4]PNR95850.1 ABC transporter ATP-binding protein [Petrotoga sp. 9PWA.NaAc.5.4]
MGNVLIVSNLSKSFDKLLVIDNWNLQIKDGERIVLVGPSGCGKTTFFRIISGLEMYNTGKVDIFVEKIGYVFQEPRLLPWRNVFDNLKLIREDEKKINEIINMMGLSSFKSILPSKLSGGMKQRVNLARALLVEPQLLIMDEPFSSLDLKIKLSIMKDIKKLWLKDRFSMLMVTHDIKEAIFLADKIIILSNRPSKILKTFEVKLREEERDITDRRFLDLESEITKFVVSNNY